MKQKMWIMLTAAVLLAVLWCGIAAADSSGTCGENLTWTLTSSTGRLAISGFGAMTDYSSDSSVPWYASRESIKSLEIGDSVTGIGKYAFYGCTGLTGVTIPDSVTVIGHYAFNGCTSLTGITIPASVTKIKYMAFKNCSNLTGAIILNDSAAIGDYDHDVFQYCASGFTLKGWSDSTAETYASAAGHTFVALDSGSCGDNVSFVYNRAYYRLTISGIGAMMDFYNSSDALWYEYRESIRSIVIKNGVTSISRYAFDGCTFVNRIVIPASVTYIGYRAFRSCENLHSVTVANSACVIGDSDYDVFDGCASDLTISGWSGSTAETYASAAGHAFKSLGSTSGQIGDTVYYTINSASGTVSITGTGPMWDYDYNSHSPLHNNAALNSVTVGSCVTSIGDYAFYECTGLTGITIPDSVTSIGSHAFYFCNGLTSITIPDSVTSIGSQAFDNCRSLTEITIPDSVTSIGDHAFSYCTGLTSVTIPSSVTSIEGGAFSYCTGLTSVTIPSSVTSIEWGAFYGCAGLTSVIIPNSVTSIEGNPFYYCTSLKEITVAAGNSKYCSDRGVLFDRNKETIVCYPTGKADAKYNIPSGVTSIGNDAFSHCTGLTSVTIPNSVTSIGDYAFRECSGLTGITIPNSVTSIGNYAFESCRSLTSVTIPKSVTSIGIGAFRDCQKLANVTIHNSETGISGYEVFYGCASTLYLHGHTGSTAETYAGNYDYITFVALTAEMGTPDFRLPAHLTAIEAEAFSGIKATVVYIPDTVTSIGSKAFSNCTELTQIRIPASVTVIPPDVFYGLTSTQLKSITVFSTPGSVAETYAKEKGMKFEVE